MRSKNRRLAAKPQAAAKESKEQQRLTKAATHGPREEAGPSAEACHEPHKVFSSLAPTTAALESEDNELAPSGVAKLRVSSLLSAASKSLPTPMGRPGWCRTQTGTTPKCKRNFNDFNAALVLPAGINIEVTEPDVQGLHVPYSKIVDLHTSWNRKVCKEFGITRTG